MVWKITDEIFDTMAGEVRLTINGISVQAPQDQSLLVTIRQQGIDIPTLCHHSDLPSEGQCRLCVVEIGEISAPAPSTPAPTLPKGAWWSRPIRRAWCRPGG